MTLWPVRVGLWLACAFVCGGLAALAHGPLWVLGACCVMLMVDLALAWAGRGWE